MRVVGCRDAAPVVRALLLCCVLVALARVACAQNAVSTGWMAAGVREIHDANITLAPAAGAPLTCGGGGAVSFRPFCTECGRFFPNRKLCADWRLASLTWKAFGFSLPVDALVIGIEVEVSLSVSSLCLSEEGKKRLSNVTLVGPSSTLPRAAAASVQGTCCADFGRPEYVSLGTNATLFGITGLNLTSSDVNTPGFGVDFQLVNCGDCDGTILVDCCLMRLTYRQPSPPTTLSSSVQTTTPPSSSAPLTSSVLSSNPASGASQASTSSQSSTTGPATTKASGTSTSATPTTGESPTGASAADGTSTTPAMDGTLASSATEKSVPSTEGTGAVTNGAPVATDTSEATTATSASSPHPVAPSATSESKGGGGVVQLVFIIISAVACVGICVTGSTILLCRARRHKNRERATNQYANMPVHTPTAPNAGYGALSLRPPISVYDWVPPDGPVPNGPTPIGPAPKGDAPNGTGPAAADDADVDLESVPMDTASSLAPATPKKKTIIYSELPDVEERPDPPVL